MSESEDSKKKSYQSTGHTMWWIFWLIALGLLTLFFGQIEEAFYNPNAQPAISDSNNIRQVTLERNRYHHYVASGTINEQDVTFFLDTGASAVVIPEALAIELGLPKGRTQQSSTANGVITVYRTKIKRLTIGNIVLNNVEASINPYMDDMDILLGMSALKNLDFSQQNNTLVLKQYY